MATNSETPTTDNNASNVVPTSTDVRGTTLATADNAATTEVTPVIQSAQSNTADRTKTTEGPRTDDKSNKTTTRRASSRTGN